MSTEALRKTGQRPTTSKGRGELSKKEWLWASSRMLNNVLLGLLSVLHDDDLGDAIVDRILERVGRGGAR